MRLSQIILLFCILAGIAVLCGLGFWQLNRLAWKEEMIARVERGLSADPKSIFETEQDMRNGQDIEYRPTFAEGRFLNDKEQHFFATHKGLPGYFIYTPLELADGRILFVNRGHVPMTLKPSNLRTDGQIEGQVRISGLARSAPSEKPNSFVPNNDLTKNIYYWKSLPQMVGRSFDKMEIGVVRLFLDADATPNNGGYPVGGVTLIQFPNNHLQYALTWFGLAGALLGVGGFFVYSRRNSSARI